MVTWSCTAIRPKLRRCGDAGLDATEYPASVARTLLLLIRQLGREHPAAEKLLWLFAFLAPGDIDLDLLSAGHAETGKPLAKVLASRRERDRAARALVTANLATPGTEGHVRIPPLVLAVARSELNDGTSAKWARRALNLIRATVPSDPADHRSWPVYAAMAAHIKATTGAASSGSQSADRIALLRNLGIYLSASKQPEAAHASLDDALAIAVRTGDGDPADMAKTADDLAIVHWQRGQLGDARARNERALADFLAAYGHDHPETARAYGNCGVFQLEMGEFEAARRSFEHALAIFLTAFGRWHLDVARTLDNLGIIGLGLDQPHAARVMFEEALAIFGKVGHADDREVADILMNLSLAQWQLGNLREAQASIERALPIFLAAYGSGHPAVAAVLAHLGVVRRQARDFKGAYVSVKQAFDILHEVYGPDPHELIRVLTSLGLLQRRKITSYLISRTLASRIMRPVPEESGSESSPDARSRLAG